MTEKRRIIGKRVKLAREELGLTQKKLAELLGMKSRDTIYKIESGQRRVSIIELVMFITALNKPFGFFVNPVGESA